MKRTATLLVLALTGCSGLFGIDFDKTDAADGGAGGNGNGGALPAGGAGGGFGGGALGGGGFGGGPECTPTTTTVTIEGNPTIKPVALRATSTGYVVVGNVEGTWKSITDRPFALYLDHAGVPTGSAIALTEGTTAVDAIVAGPNQDQVYVAGSADENGAGGPFNGWVHRIEPGTFNQTPVYISTSQAGLASWDKYFTIAPNADGSRILAAGRCTASNLSFTGSGGAANFSSSIPMDAGTAWSCPTSFALDLGDGGRLTGGVIDVPHSTTSGISSTPDGVYLVGYTLGKDVNGVTTKAPNHWFLAKTNDAFLGTVEGVDVAITSADPVGRPRPNISAFKAGATHIDVASLTDSAQPSVWRIKRFNDQLMETGAQIDIVAAGGAELELPIHSTADGVAAVAIPLTSDGVKVGPTEMTNTVSSVAVRLDDNLDLVQLVLPSPESTLVRRALVEEHSMVMVGIAAAEDATIDGHPIMGLDTRIFFHRACRPE